MEIFMAQDKTIQNSGNTFPENALFRKKALALFIIAFLLFISFLIVRHYFYILDSYYYSAEFHTNFMLHNLRDANLELVTEYFKSLATAPKILPMLLYACLIQNGWVLFSKPILVPAVAGALGLPQSAALSFFSFIFTGLVFFGIGVFFLGDILPLLLKRQSLENVSPSKKYSIYGIAGALFAFPVIPLIVPSLFSALVRVRIKPFFVIMLSCVIVRLLLLISLQEVFIQ